MLASVMSPGGSSLGTAALLAPPPSRPAPFLFAADELEAFDRDTDESAKPARALSLSAIVV